MKFRLFCFGSHLMVSLLVALLAMGLVFWVWYPSPLDKALGVASIFLLMLCIDVIVGPLLTLLVAKKGKKTLRMDLVTIGIIQLLALAYGLYMVAQGRPVWIVYDSGRFEVVQAYEAVFESDDSLASNAFQLELTGPVWAAVSDSVPSSVANGDAYYRAKFLRDYDEKIAVSAGTRAYPIAVLKRFNEPRKVDAILSSYPEADGFIPIAAKQKSLAMLVSKKAIGRPIAIVDLSPW